MHRNCPPLRRRTTTNARTCPWNSPSTEINKFISQLAPTRGSHTRGVLSLKTRNHRLFQLRCELINLRFTRINYWLTVTFDLLLSFGTSVFFFNVGECYWWGMKVGDSFSVVEQFIWLPKWIVFLCKQTEETKFHLSVSRLVWVGIEGE